MQTEITKLKKQLKKLREERNFVEADLVRSKIKKLIKFYKKYE